jgi:hypothetical protein
MPRRLVFVHGRAQQNKDAVAIKQQWIASLREGLAKSNLEFPIEEEDVRFPFYGDTLYQMSVGVDTATAARVIVRGEGIDGPKLEFICDVLEEIRGKAGISDEEIQEELNAEIIERGPFQWGWVQGILRIIDRKVPFGSGVSVALFMNDVYRYLTEGGIRDHIESGVLQAISPGEPTVVVGHSLGSIVAYNLLRREGHTRNWQIPMYVTVGSPLGVRRIRKALAPISYPACIKSWFNAIDERDVVALYPLERPHFGVDPAIKNKLDVKNQTENHHGISGYLGDAEVAKTIYDAIVGN